MDDNSEITKRLMDMNLCLDDNTINKLDIMGYPVMFSSADEIKYAMETIVQEDWLLKCRGALEQLYMDGPVDDGDIVSKAQRDWLIKNGYAERVIFKQSDGFTACTYKGRDALKLFRRN